jgi:hypothetical protein
MWKRTVLSIGAFGLLVLPTHGRFVSAAPDHPLEGVWEVEQAGQPFAGVYIFAHTHYSMMVASTSRPEIADVSKATADELRALWNPMLGNAGVYEVTGDLVTIRPIVAKIPAVMKPGAYEVYAFRVEGSALFLTQRRNTRGPVENGATTKLVRVE